MVLNGLLARGAFWSRTTPRPLANTYAWHDGASFGHLRVAEVPLLRGVQAQLGVEARWTVACSVRGGFVDNLM